MKTAAIDWAHTKPVAYYIDSEINGEKKVDELVDFLKTNKIEVVVGENIPIRILIPLLESEFKIFRCSGTSTKIHRDENDIEKSDINDAKAIFELYNLKPELFYQYTEKDKMFLRAKALYKFRASLMKTRVQYGNKIEMYSKYNIFDKDILDKLRNMHTKLISSENFLGKQFGCNEYFGKYIKQFEDVKGISNITVAEVVSEIGNINRFPTLKNFMSYVFGYGKSNHNHNLKIRFLLSAKGMVMLADNSKYCKLYYDYKAYLELKHPERVIVDGKIRYNKSHFDALAKRRVAREIAKLFYIRLKEYSIKDTGICMKKEQYISPILVSESI